jgi:hypothetical protein
LRLRDTGAAPAFARSPATAIAATAIAATAIAATATGNGDRQRSCLWRVSLSSDAVLPRYRTLRTI